MEEAGVSVKSAQPGERLSARRHHTVVVLLPRVRALVVTQGARSSEPLSTSFADKGLLTRVRAHVPTQGARVSEPLSTRLADKGLLPRVRAHVGTQGARFSERLST